MNKINKLPNCKDLTYKAEKLKRPYDNYHLWEFVRSWLRKFEEMEIENVFEKFIFLWVSVNAWAAKSVPDLTRNHEDSYLLHCMAKDSELSERFTHLYEIDREFQREVNDFLKLAPVFQAIWLQNHNIPPWDRSEDRSEFVMQVFKQNPYIEKKDKKGDPIFFPAFSPACAEMHLFKKVSIPVDWPHILHMIYQVRCNLFHGGKIYNKKSDLLFVRLANSILWGVWKEEAPLPIKRIGRRDHLHELKENLTQDELPWKRILIRSGFRICEQGEKIIFLNETEQNKQYFKKIINGSDFGHFNDDVFIPREAAISQNVWLDTVELYHTGAEGGSPDDLYIMDTYMAGLVRWINEIGISTNFSCDGNGEKKAVFITNDEENAILATWLLNNKAHQFNHLNRTVEFIKSNRLHHLFRSINYRMKLLDYAEWLHDNKADLNKILELKLKITKNSNSCD